MNRLRSLICKELAKNDAKMKWPRFGAGNLGEKCYKRVKIERSDQAPATFLGKPSLWKWVPGKELKDNSERNEV